MKKTIMSDQVSLESYRKLNFACACEDCTHFDPSTEKCTFNYPTGPHLRRNQLKQLEVQGTMAFCRAIEID